MEPRPADARLARSRRQEANSGLDPSGTYAGFSAQNMQKAIPEAVGRDQKGFLSLSDRPVMATIVNAIKELKGMFDGDHAEIIKLKAANDDLVSETSALRVQLKAANDNYAELRQEVEALKRKVGR